MLSLVVRLIKLSQKIKDILFKNRSQTGNFDNLNLLCCVLYSMSLTDYIRPGDTLCWWCLTTLTQHVIWSIHHQIVLCPCCINIMCGVFTTSGNDSKSLNILRVLPIIHPHLASFVANALSTNSLVFWSAITYHCTIIL